MVNSNREDVYLPNQGEIQMNNVRKKIMMVDDDPTILKIGRLMLKDHYEVYPLLSSAKLFETLERVTPDLILLDIMMPEVDGIETLKRLKADDRYTRIPVIFVSSIDDDKSVFEHLKLGAYSDVSKPFTADELLSRIENCLNDYFPDETPKAAEIVDEDNKKKVLAVDDAPDILKMVYLFLRDTYKVYTLSEPEKLDTLLQTLTPDLFLLDYKMPTLSGIDLIPIIRKYPKLKETPIIFLTSEKSPEFIKEVVRLGACDFIMKPVRAELLKEKVETHIK